MFVTGIGVVVQQSISKKQADDLFDNLAGGSHLARQVTCHWINGSYTVVGSEFLRSPVDK